MTKRDTLVVDPLALPNSSDRLRYIVSPSEDRSLTGSSYKDRPIVKNKQELAKYNIKGQEVYIPPLVIRYRIAYNIEYKTYIGFLFSTITSISIAINIYKAIIYIVYIYIDPSSNINYLTPGLLLVPFYS